MNEPSNHPYGTIREPRSTAPRPAEVPPRKLRPKDNPGDTPGMRHLRELAEKEPDLVKAMARVAAAADNAYRHLKARVNQDGSVTLAPAEAQQLLGYLSLRS